MILPTTTLLAYDPGRRVPFVKDAAFARDEYQWSLCNTGQHSTLFTSQGPTSTESGSVDIGWSPDSHGCYTTVGVVDSGCNTNIPDLADVVVQSRTFSVYAGTPPDGSPGGADNDPIQHGTRLCGLVAGLGNQLTGVAPGANLVVAATGYHEVDIPRGLTWCVESGADVVLLAWGTSYPFPELRAACSLARERGVAIVCALPNRVLKPGERDYPSDWAGEFDNILPVAACNRDGSQLVPSAWRPEAVSAPGRNIVTLTNAGPAYCSGTSYAAPLVAGAYAVLKAVYPGQSPAALIAALRGSAVGDLRRIHLRSALAWPRSSLTIAQCGGGVFVTVVGRPGWRYLLERSGFDGLWTSLQVVDAGASVQVEPGLFRAKTL